MGYFVSEEQSKFQFTTFDIAIYHSPALSMLLLFRCLATSILLTLLWVASGILSRRFDEIRGRYSRLSEERYSCNAIEPIDGRRRCRREWQ